MRRNLVPMGNQKYQPSDLKSIKFPSFDYQKTSYIHVTSLMNNGEVFHRVGKKLLQSLPRGWSSIGKILLADIYELGFNVLEI
jgi:hypothetical protein